MSRKMLLVLLSFIMVLAGCTAVVSIIAEEGIKQRAQELIDQARNIITGNDIDYESLKELIYVPQSDVNDSDVEDAVFGTREILYYDFTVPSTITSCSVVSVNELNTTKAFPWSLSNKPDFVENVYALTVEGITQDGTKTFFSLPMIEVSSKLYFWTIYVYSYEQKDVVLTPATEVRVYPEFLFY